MIIPTPLKIRTLKEGKYVVLIRSYMYTQKLEKDYSNFSLY